MSDPFHRPPIFFRPPPCNNFVGRMPWGSPRHPHLKNYRPPFLRGPFGATPESLLLPSHMQPPPMFGPRGATLPPRLMSEYYQRGKSPKFNSDHADEGDSSKQFWCEPCDRGFNSKEMMDRHNSEHQKCGIDGCSFTAHANIVTKHIQMQHRTGLYDKIRNINTPEDIENWIKERKKNYPTRENIEKQKAQQKESFERGEKLQDDKSRFNNNKSNRGRTNSRENKYQDRKSKFHNKKLEQTNYSNQTSSTSINSPKIETENRETPRSEKKYAKTRPAIQDISDFDENKKYCNLNPFKGTSELVRYDLICNDQVVPVVNDLDIEDHEWQENDTNKTIKKEKLSVCNALSNLMSAYDSSDEDSNDTSFVKIGTRNITEKNNKEISLMKKQQSSDSSDILLPPIPKDTALIISSLSVLNDAESDGSGPEEIKNIKIQEELPPLHEESSNRKRTRKRKHSSNVSNPLLEKLPHAVSKEKTPKDKNVRKNNFRRRVPKTLLEKLLEKDIKNERNTVLQCIHYIVQNNFFNK